MSIFSKHVKREGNLYHIDFKGIIDEERQMQVYRSWVERESEKQKLFDEVRNNAIQEMYLHDLLDNFFGGGYGNDD